MILSVIEQYHDYSPRRFFLDTDKLNPDDYVDSLILKKIKSKSYQLELHIDCCNWEQSGLFNDEPSLNGAACFKKVKNNQTVEKELYIRFFFE